MPNILDRFERIVRDIRDQHLRSYHHVKLPEEMFDPAIEKRSISFCTTCMNRFFHLKKTFLQNIHDNITYPNVEFVLINYNSQDGLHEWAKKELPPYIKKGIVNYYHTTEPKFFHASIAKNLAHKVAKGEVVCNVDGDNFTGKDFAYFLNYKIHTMGDQIVWHIKKAPFWGTEGRIALAKKYFEALGGYDEAFESIGHEDHDLIDRARALGLKYSNVQIENFLHYLSNTTREKSENCTKEPVNYYDLESRNKQRSQRNIANNILQANPNGWGMLPMYKNFSTEAKIY